jgi:PIN domain nuclease of toxin-antitoxin system
VRYLLDTAVWLWAQTRPERLGKKAGDLLSSLPAGDEVFLSAASSWEISIKFYLGKLPLPEPPSVYVPRRLGGIQPLVVTHAHALAAGELPLHHRDPFDRLLIAQARLEGMTVLTTDRVFAQYGVPVIWCGGT